MTKVQGDCLEAPPPLGTARAANLRCRLGPSGECQLSQVQHKEKQNDDYC
jgi:hypothetical protein